MIEIIPNWHPLFVHFPIAFATAAVFFMALGKLFKIKPWATQCRIFGRWMLWAAAIFACIAALFGWFAYNSVDHDDAGHLAMTLHRNWALGTLGALLLLVVIDVWPKRSTAQPSYGFLLLMFTVWLLVISTAWHGGELVYRHGLGVLALPEVDEDQASTPHADGEHEQPHQHDHAHSH
jgi:uncharacterized membrane protein